MCRRGRRAAGGGDWTRISMPGPLVGARHGPHALARPHCGWLGRPRRESPETAESRAGPRAAVRIAESRGSLQNALRWPRGALAGRTPVDGEDGASTHRGAKRRVLVDAGETARPRGRGFSSASLFLMIHPLVDASVQCCCCKTWIYQIRIRRMERRRRRAASARSELSGPCAYGVRRTVGWPAGVACGGARATAERRGRARPEPPSRRAAEPRASVRIASREPRARGPARRGQPCVPLFSGRFTDGRIRVILAQTSAAGGGLSRAGCRSVRRLSDGRPPVQRMEDNQRTGPRCIPGRLAGRGRGIG